MQHIFDTIYQPTAGNEARSKGRACSVLRSEFHIPGIIPNLNEIAYRFDHWPAREHNKEYDTLCYDTLCYAPLGQRTICITTMRLQLTIKAENLKKVGAFRVGNPYAIATITGGERIGEELGRTEV